MSNHAKVLPFLNMLHFTEAKLHYSYYQFHGPKRNGLNEMHIPAFIDRFGSKLTTLNMTTGIKLYNYLGYEFTFL
jgi:hypothetical protein